MKGEATGDGQDDSAPGHRANQAAVRMGETPTVLWMLLVMSAHYPKQVEGTVLLTKDWSKNRYMPRVP